MLDRRAVGRTAAPHLNEVEKGDIRRFAESLGDDSSVFRDEAAAQAAGHPGIVAPPTFATTLQSGSPASHLLGVAASDLTQREHALQLVRPIIAGDRIWVTSRIVEIKEENTGVGIKRDVAAIEDEGRDEKGEVVFRGRREYVFRSGRELPPPAAPYTVPQD
jgi:acyl dehydratase